MYGRPQPPPSSGPNVLLIVVIVVAVLLVLGGGGCLLCVGLAASVDSREPAEPSTVPVAPTPTASATITPTVTPTIAPTPKPVVTAKPAPTPAAGPRVVDFVCPPGKPPGGAVRAGCLCGSDILGTACGAPGDFVEVTETPRGCRFVCR